MLKYIIYALVAALAVWAVWYLIRTVRRQLREGCGCGGNCYRLFSLYLTQPSPVHGKHPVVQLYL